MCLTEEALVTTASSVRTRLGLGCWSRTHIPHNSALLWRINLTAWGGNAEIVICHVPSTRRRARYALETAGIVDLVDGDDQEQRMPIHSRKTSGRRINTKGRQQPRRLGLGGAKVHGVGARRSWYITAAFDSAAVQMKAKRSAAFN